MKRDILNKTLVIVLIFLFISVSIQPAFAIKTKTSANITEKETDCDCNKLNYKNDYPPIICIILRLMICIIGPSGDLIGLFLIYLGFTREQVENFLSPAINFYNSIEELFNELNCSPWHPQDTISKK